MARPNKQGLDYFPLDIHLDNKMKFIEVKFGLEGFAVTIKLFQEIYSQGYWIKWEEDEQFLFASDHRVDFDKLEKIVAEGLKRGIFDQGLYEKYQILTSTGIQKRYQEIVKRRKDVIVNADYVLIDGNFGVNVNINSDNDDTPPPSGEQPEDIPNTEGEQGDGTSTQRKGKEMERETERKGETEKTGAPAPPVPQNLKELNPFAKVSRKYQECISHATGPNQVTTMQYWISENPNLDLILFAIEKARDKDGKPPQKEKFVDWILRDWSERGLDTLEKAKSYEASREQKGKTGVDVNDLQAQILARRGG